MQVFRRQSKFKPWSIFRCSRSACSGIWIGTLGMTHVFLITSVCSITNASQPSSCDIIWYFNRMILANGLCVRLIIVKGFDSTVLTCPWESRDPSWLASQLLYVDVEQGGSYSKNTEGPTTICLSVYVIGRGRVCFVCDVHGRAVTDFALESPAPKNT